MVTHYPLGDWVLLRWLETISPQVERGEIVSVGPDAQAPLEGASVVLYDRAAARKVSFGGALYALVAFPAILAVEYDDDEDDDDDQ